MAAMQPSARAIARAITTELRTRFPEIDTPPDRGTLLDEMEQSCHSNAEQVLRLLAAGQPESAMVLPAAVTACAVGLARRGISIAIGIRAYQLAHRQLWQLLSRELISQLTDKAVVSSSLDAMAAFMFDYVDSLTERLADAYHAEERRRAGTAAAARAGLRARSCGRLRGRSERQRAAAL